MAMTHDEPDIMELHPKWPDVADVLTKQQYTAVYDGVSDTFYFDFYGPGRAAVNVEIDKGDHDYMFQRVDVETQEVVGLQIDDFLAYAVSQDPYFLDVLAFAELHHVTPDQAVAIRRALSRAQDHSASPASFLDHVEKMTA